MPEKISSNLSGVAETLLITLDIRAMESQMTCSGQCASITSVLERV